MLRNPIKVTFAGETKRIQAPESFEELVKATRLSFPQMGEGVIGYKFYLRDEEQELISISSQDDFDDNSDYILVDSAQAANESARVTPTLIYSDSASDASE